MINEKELIKQIKKSSKNLIWSNQEGVHYITNRHWAVKYKEIPRAVLITLFSIFGQMPNDNSTVQISFREIEHSKLVDIKKIMKIGSDLKSGIVTSVLSDFGELARVIKCDGQIILAMDDYIKITYDDKPLCKANHGPLFFSNGDVIILPLRTTEVTHIEIIQELIA